MFFGVGLGGFNSLQTERAWELEYATRKGYLRKFRFPKNGKVRMNIIMRKDLADGQYTMFRFPTNGKAHRNARFIRNQNGIEIGFDSLPTGKHMGTITEAIEKFDPERVSIPYQRESTWEPTVVVRNDHIGVCFDSLPTGKHMGTSIKSLAKRGLILSFDSLPTGKHM